MKIRVFIFAIVVCICTVFMGCKTNKKGVSDNTTWSVYRGSAKSNSYSGLKKINRNNVSHLQVAWKFSPEDALKGTGFNKTESNPIVVNGIMYTAFPHDLIYAIDAKTGKKIWSFNPFSRSDKIKISKIRGVTYWAGESQKYILFTAGDHLFEVDALSGKPVSKFGQDGRVDLRKGLRDPVSTISVPIRVTSPGIIYQDLIIIGNRGSDTYGDIPGDIRAYNVHSGKLVWTFHVIPRPGEKGYRTWPKNAWKYVGGAGAWAGLAVDKERGIVFATTGSASYDFYGGGRAPGKNLYANCVLAIDAATGKLIWHFQTVHHDLWDYDLAAPPNLVSVVRNGKEIDAVAAESKNGFLFVLNRETGKPLFPVVEKKVPASDVPGEQAYPTQPFPLKPKPFANQHMTDSLIADFDPQTHDSLLAVFHSLRYEGLFTPPSTRGTLEMPATIGGIEWGSVAYDPETHIIYIKSTNNEGEIVKLKKKEATKKAGMADKTLYERGKLFYTQSCAGCHGVNRKGKGNNPSLINLKQRMTTKAVLQQINNGGGVMPSFSQVFSDVQKKAVIAYLFNNEKAKITSSQSSEGKTNALTLHEKLIKKGRDPKLPMYRNATAYRAFSDKKGRLATKPPWSLLSAINLNTGEYEWQITVGKSRGPIVTAGGLVFLATSGIGDGYGSRGDYELQAFDKTTGKLIWKAKLPAAATGTPATYTVDGKQYLTFMIAGTKANPGGSVMAFTLTK